MSGVWVHAKRIFVIENERARYSSWENRLLRLQLADEHHAEAFGAAVLGVQLGGAKAGAGSDLVHHERSAALDELVQGGGLLVAGAVRLGAMGDPGVAAPFQDVAVHVEQAERIGLAPADGLGGFQRLYHAVFLQQGAVVAETPDPRVAGPAGEFPLLLAGQGVTSSLFQTQPVAEGPGVVPGDVNDGVFLRLGKRRRLPRPFWTLLGLALA